MLSDTPEANNRVPNVEKTPAIDVRSNKVRQSMLGASKLTFLHRFTSVVAVR